MAQKPSSRYQNSSSRSNPNRKPTNRSSKPPNKSKQSKLASKLSVLRYRWSKASTPTRALSFALVFAVLAGSVYLWHSFALSQYGGLPTNAGEIVLQYNLPMAHAVALDDFSPGAPPAMLLYSSGLMLCSDPHASHTSTDTSPLQTLRQRQLTSAQMTDLVAQVRSLGFDTVANRIRNPKTAPPSGANATIQLNTTKGATTATQYPGEAEFTAVANYLNSQCALATTAYTPDDVVVESHKLDSTNPVAQANASAPAVPTALIPTDAVPTTTAVKRLTGAEARTVKTEVGAANHIYKAANDVVKVRVLPKVPDFKAPKRKVAKASNKSNKVYAAGANNVRFLYVVAADQGVPANAQANLNDLAGSLPGYYQGQVGRTFRTSQISIVRGAKTAGQYQACPANGNCQGYPSLAAYYNLENEFGSLGSTVVLYSWASSEGCIGWGGPTGGANYQDAVGTYDTGFAALSDASCYWPDARHQIGAHETGHTFGFSHTCDATLMGSCGYSKPAGYQVPIYGPQISELQTQSPYFAAPPQTTIQGINVDEGMQSLGGVVISYKCCDTARAATGANPYFFPSLYQGFHRLHADAPAGYHLVGVSNCWDSGAGCSESSVTNPTGSDGDFVIDTTGHTTANLWWHFARNVSTSVQGYAMDENLHPLAGAAFQFKCCTYTNTWQTTNPYYWGGLPQGYQRIHAQAPDGYHLVGFTLCYDSNSCHGQTPTFTSDADVVINTTGHTSADLWWHFAHNPPGSGTGLSTYFYGSFFTSPAGLQQRSYYPDVDWGTGGPGVSANNDNWNDAWYGSIKPPDTKAPSTDTYTFTTGCDDGCLLWINGQLVVNDWANHGYTEVSGTIALTAGQAVPIKLLHFDGVGAAVTKLFWSSSTMPKQIVQQQYLYPLNANNGLAGYFWNNPNFSGAPVFSRTDPHTYFAWSNGPGGGIPSTNFSAYWVGNLTAPATGTYTFAAGSDDGSYLIINNQVVINNWGVHAFPGANGNYVSGTYNLTAGQSVPIALYYNQYGGGAGLYLAWSGPGVPSHWIDPMYLTH